eukprot:TRINITY_DN121733_c0_g1_i1.p1 TRINITY_DN121733_c0_g1~~TRINITY_DN121733_c0_g1_i1.p1  ORF type:complete len:1158 (+),score=235.05 TRINITY_DN121733_c0_g1_i1:62-3535(+)
MSSAPKVPVPPVTSKHHGTFLSVTPAADPMPPGREEEPPAMFCSEIADLGAEGAGGQLISLSPDVDDEDQFEEMVVQELSQLAERLAVGHRIVVEQMLAEHNIDVTLGSGEMSASKKLAAVLGGRKVSQESEDDPGEEATSQSRQRSRDRQGSAGRQRDSSQSPSNSSSRPGTRASSQGLPGQVHDEGLSAPASGFGISAQKRKSGGSVLVSLGYSKHGRGGDLQKHGTRPSGVLPRQSGMSYFGGGPHSPHSPHAQQAHHGRQVTPLDEIWSSHTAHTRPHQRGSNLNQSWHAAEHEKESTLSPQILAALAHKPHVLQQVQQALIDAETEHTDHHTPERPLLRNQSKDVHLNSGHHGAHAGGHGSHGNGGHHSDSTNGGGHSRLPRPTSARAACSGSKAIGSSHDDLSHPTTPVSVSEDKNHKAPSDGHQMEEQEDDELEAVANGKKKRYSGLSRSTTSSEVNRSEVSGPKTVVIKKVGICNVDQQRGSIKSQQSMHSAVSFPGDGYMSPRGSGPPEDEDESFHEFHTHPWWVDMSRNQNARPTLCTGKSMAVGLLVLPDNDCDIESEQSEGSQQSFEPALGTRNSLEKRKSACWNCARRCRMRCTRKNCRRLAEELVLSPNCKKRVGWDIVGVIGIFYECIMIPLSLLQFYRPPVIHLVDWMMRIYWLLDIPMSFFTGFVQEDRVMMQLRKVAKNYLQTWFVLDIFLVAIDWSSEMILLVTGSDADAGQLKLGKIIKGVRIFRLARAWRFLRSKAVPNVARRVLEFYCSNDVVNIVMGILRIMGGIAWMNHLFACIFCAMGYGDTSGSSWMYQPSMDKDSTASYYYWVAFHWALTHWSGSIEIYPGNEAERQYQVIVGLLVFVASACAVSSITSSMTHLSIVTAQESNKMAALRKFLLENCISDTVSLRVQRNIKCALHELKKNVSETQIELLDLISEPLRVEIHFEMHRPLLSQHPLFNTLTEVSPPMIRQMCHRALARISLSKGDILFTQGEMMVEPGMYFIKEGCIKYTQMDAEEAEVVMPPSWLCEGALWANVWEFLGNGRAREDTVLMFLIAERLAVVTKPFSACQQYMSRYAKEFCDRLCGTPLPELTDLPDDQIREMVMRASDALPPELWDTCNRMADCRSRMRAARHTSSESYVHQMTTVQSGPAGP